MFYCVSNGRQPGSDEPENPAVDVLSDILHAIRFRASSYYCVEFASPWGIDEPKSERCTFHAVVRGHAWLHTPENEKPLYLSAGDIVALPTGAPHQISDRPDSSLTPGSEVLEKIWQNDNPFDGEVGVTTLLCGYFQYQKKTQLPLLRDMPSLLYIKSNEDPELTWLNNLINTLAHESRSLKPGGKVVVDRLTEVLVIQLLRWYMNNQQGTHGYFRALADERLSHALSQLHHHPSRAWTVKSMAHTAGMSRSAFANHFHDIVGITPLAYLSQWRMHIAYTLLIDGNESMLSIAEQVGYKSEASFGKAFKNITGESPGQVRKAARHKPGENAGEPGQG